MDYAQLLAAAGNVPADAEVRVRSRTVEYVVTGVAVEMDLGPHLEPEDVPLPAGVTDDPDAPGQARALAAPLLRQRAEIAACDGACTEHRAQTSTRRTVVLTVERA